MLHKSIRVEAAPAAIGPYSQAVVCNNLLFVSGQLPIDVSTGTFPGTDIALQTKQSLENIKAILEGAGSDLSKVVKTTIFLQDMADFSAMNEVYGAYFSSDPLPARAAVQVAALPKGAKIEIEAVALLPE